MGSSQNCKSQIVLWYLWSKFWKSGLVLRVWKIKLILPTNVTDCQFTIQAAKDMLQVLPWCYTIEVNRGEHLCPSWSGNNTLLLIFRYLSAGMSTRRCLLYFSIDSHFLSIIKSRYDMRTCALLPKTPVPVPPNQTLPSRTLARLRPHFETILSYTSYNMKKVSPRIVIVMLFSKRSGCSRFWFRQVDIPSIVGT